VFFTLDKGAIVRGEGEIVEPERGAGKKIRVGLNAR